MSTLNPTCLPSGGPQGAEAVAFFQTVVTLFQVCFFFSVQFDTSIIDHSFNRLSRHSRGFQTKGSLRLPPLRTHWPVSLQPSRQSPALVSALSRNYLDSSHVVHFSTVHPSVQVLREHPQCYSILFPPEREYYRWSFPANRCVWSSKLEDLL